MITLAIANQKGGTGKTATAHNLGVLLSDRLHVVMIDTDPQSSLTRSAGIDPARSLAEVMTGAATMPDIIQTISNGLDLAPADIDLAGVELAIVSRIGRETILKRAMQKLSGYDLALIDCGPSLSMLTVNALTAADAVLIPTQPQAVDLRGLTLFMQTIDQVKTELNPGLEVIGILPTFYDNRLNHHKQAVETMQAAGLPVLPVMIGRSVRVAEASGAGQAVATFEPNNPQAENYRQLAEVVFQWLKKTM